MLGSKVQIFEALKQKVAAFETRPLLANAETRSAPSGLLAIPPGYVHEIFADSLVNAGAALGFGLAQARGMLEAERPGLLILQLKSDTQELGTPYAPGFKTFGLEAHAIVLIRTESIVELLWAMEEAIACRAIAAVVADIAYPHKALDFTASRRLALRAAASGASVFIVRYAKDREASAARYRWRVAPCSSQKLPFDDKAPGPPRWEITLEKGSLDKHRLVNSQGDRFIIDWTENGFALADIDSRYYARAPAIAALSHAAPAALGHRLSQAS